MLKREELMLRMELPVDDGVQLTITVGWLSFWFHFVFFLARKQRSSLAPLLRARENFTVNRMHEIISWRYGKFGKVTFLSMQNYGSTPFPTSMNAMIAIKMLKSEFQFIYKRSFNSSAAITQNEKVGNRHRQNLLAI